MLGGTHNRNRMWCLIEECEEHFLGFGIGVPDDELLLLPFLMTTKEVSVHYHCVEERRAHFDPCWIRCDEDA